MLGRQFGVEIEYIALQTHANIEGKKRIRKAKKKKILQCALKDTSRAVEFKRAVVRTYRRSWLWLRVNEKKRTRSDSTHSFGVKNCMGLTVRNLKLAAIWTYPF